MMPQSMAMYCGFHGWRVATKMFPGCMSAWKKLSRNTWVKNISTPRSASSFMSVRWSARVARSVTGMP
ncbi:hypothetical protein D9M71_717620 [compost metagenome]